MKPLFNKHKYIKVYTYNETMTMNVSFHKIATFKPRFLIHPTHVFNHNGFASVLVTNTATETINPLDFNSKYPADRFKTAIESKAINDALGSLNSSKIDMMKVMLFASLFINLIVLYILMKNNGVL